MGAAKRMSVQVQVTQYGPAALDALREVVASAKSTDPMAPVTILVPHTVAGIAVRRHLAHGLGSDGPGVAGIELTTVPRLAERLAAHLLAPRRPATGPVLSGAWRRTLAEDPAGLGEVATHPATVQAVAAAHERLRTVSAAALDEIAAAGGVSADVVDLHRRVVARLAPDWYDRRDLLDRAQEAGADLGTVVLYLPQLLTPPEIDFLRTLAERTDLVVIAGRTGADRADAPVLDAVRAAGGQVTSQAAAAPRTADRVIHASDSDDEVRCVVREVLTTLRSTPAHRIGVLYASADPYARLLQEHLTAVGVTINGPGARPVAERATARLLIEVLSLADRDLARGDLFRALANAPARDFTGARIPVSAWERLSRSAGVVAGDHWADRIDDYITEERRRLEVEAAADDPRDWLIERGQNQVATAEALRAFSTRLRTELARAEALTSWRELATWSQELLRTLLGPEEQLVRLPPEEQYAVATLLTMLDGIAALDGVDPNPGLGALRQILDLGLEGAIDRVGRFGEGVFVGPVSQAPGLDLDVVFVLGLAEDLYPGRITPDPLLPEEVRARTGGELPELREQVDTAQRCLLIALGSARHAVASFPRGDLRSATGRLPSRFLLPTLRRLSGNPRLAATEWDTAGYTAVHSSSSFAGELLSTDALATEQEWRVRTVVAGEPLPDEVLHAALALTEARAGADFTRFDGNLTGLTGLPDYLVEELRVSPTALESYATCPHAFFAERLLRVSPVENPEDVVEISPADIGNLIHESIDELITTAKQAGTLPGYGQPWTKEHRAQLGQIAARLAEEYTVRGLTGHPRMWQRERQRILADLEVMLTEDDRWRAELDAKVVASELPFGLDGADPVEITAPGGRVLLRGRADKVDQARDGTVYVTDIKTGRRSRFAGISEADPVVGGTKLQLPVYAHAAQQAFGGGEQQVRAQYWFVRKEPGRIELPLSPQVTEQHSATLSLLARSIAAGLFPPKAPEKADFAWVQCPYCNPDGLGHAEVRAGWERKRHDAVLAELVALIDPAATGDPV
ncbi:PD-(D/E)XK nuclease family protein [Ruania albidiflava]|uniref:PD-(D/E)XK nuclease family protein n=1 Tax=Ruania albidiflava TaxID=366586 RepID=UPI0023F0695F|nr:PD-(D/E)XK nuclease family protein [Ruania albidiflava]